MTFNSIIVRYGEISLKGKNRRSFEHKLKNDIIGFLESKKHEFSEVKLMLGRIYIRGIESVPIPDLKKVIGVLSFSPALEIKKEYETLIKTVTDYPPVLKDKKSFRVSCQRIDKTFPHKSTDLERDMGEILFEKFHTPVNLKNPDLHFEIEIGEKHIYIFTDKFKGFSGLPFGSAGKLVSLFSGGIDSPVATFLMMKRGVEPILIHYKITESELKKVHQLKEKLEEYAGGRKIKLHAIDRDELFHQRFSELYNDRRFHSYMCILCKYLMHKKAGEIASQEGALGIITGDNLAQVASQTLKNLFAYHTISGMPVYSPLISFEKVDTINIARDIGTYDISIATSEGCTPPRTPKTGVSKDIFENILKETDLQ
jgi:thiamine biosynthesis protein ThiI